MAKTKTRSRAASAKTVDKKVSKAKAPARNKAQKRAVAKTAHARRATKAAKPATNSRTPVAQIAPLAHIAQVAKVAQVIAPAAPIDIEALLRPAAARAPQAELASPLRDMLERALRDIARRKRQLSQHAKREFALLRLNTRPAQRRAERSLQSLLRQISALRRELRGAGRDLRGSARRNAHRLRADFVAVQRNMQTSAWRRLRYAKDSLSRKAERKLDDAGSAMRRTFRPVIARVVPYHRAAIAGGAAALAVTLISIGSLVLFDQATAIPSREVSQVVTLASDWQRLADRTVMPAGNPVLSNIALPAPKLVVPASRDLDATDLGATKLDATNLGATNLNAMASAPADRDFDAASTKTPRADVPLPAPTKRNAAPARAERPAARHNRHRARDTRSNRQHISAHATDAMASVGNATGGVSIGFGGSGLVSEARRYLGTNPTGRGSLWCGAFMDLVLRKSGYKGGGNLALGYEHYGTRVSGPQIGAIAVMGRRGGGHVGVVSGIDAHGNPIIVSGNHNHTVAEAVYPRSRIITYVVPN